MRSPLWMVRSPSASELKLDSATSIKWPFSETNFKHLASDLLLYFVKVNFFYMSSISVNQIVSNNSSCKLISQNIPDTRALSQLKYEVLPIE